MGVKISIEAEEVFANEDRRWLGARKGADTCRSITLDGSLFLSGHTKAKGAVPSGTALGLVTGSGLYGPYDPDGSDGREDCAGLLFSTTDLGAEGGVADTNVGAALFWEGIVKESFLPVFDSSGADDVDDEGVVDAGGKADLTFIRWEA